MNQRKPSQFARRLREFTDAEAAVLQTVLDEMLRADDYLDEAEKAACVRAALADELTHFYFRCLRFQLSDPNGALQIKRSIARAYGRKSGDKRLESSTKYQFVAWAIEEKQRAPHLSKNDLAGRYARDHPGTSVSTLRRYLGDGELKKLWPDEKGG